MKREGEDVVRQSAYRRICWIGAYRGEHCLGRYVCGALRKMGYAVDVIDYRENMGRLESLFKKVNADLAIVSRGGGIPRELIAALPCPKVLWFGEYMHGNDKHSRDRINELQHNANAFDYVVWGAGENNEAMQIMRNIGCNRVGYAYPCRFDPKIYRKMSLQKRYDVSFVGTITPRRKNFLETLSKRFDIAVRTIWDLDEQVRFFNQSRIVLHLNSFRFINIAGVNLRAFDVMGTGSFMLHEDVVLPRVFGKEFTDGRYLAFWRFDDINDLANKIEYYLSNENEREKIALAGYHFVHSNFSVEKTVHELLKRVDFTLGSRPLPSPDFVTAFNKWGRPASSYNELQNELEPWVSPKYAQSFYAVGENYYRLSKWDKAIESLEKAIDLDGNFVQARYLLSLCYWKIRKTPEAARELKRLLRIAPFHPDANRVLGKLYTELGDSEAGKYYQVKGGKLAVQRRPGYQTPQGV